MTQSARETTEMCLLGWMLSCSDQVAGFDDLSADMFSDALYQSVAECILARVGTGELVNPFVVSDILGLDGEAKKHLVDCVAASVHCIFPREYIAHLRQSRQKDGIIDICHETAAEALAEAAKPEEVVAKMIDRLNDVLRHVSGVNFRTSRAVSEAIIEGMKDIPPCYPTGIRLLDEAMGGGLYTGKSYGIAAKKKVGKTIIASTISCNLDLLNVPHLFICGEMSDEEVHQRTLARLADVYPSVFRNKAEATGPLMSRVATASFRLNGAAVYLNAPGLTFDHLRRAVATAISRYGIKGFILDYWQLVGGKPKNKSTSEHLDEVAQWVADFCRKNKLWSITTAQINQEGNTRGGEGLRLAFDQVYHMQPCSATGNPEEADTTNPARWLEMMDTRYTAWMDVGGPTHSPLYIHEKGPYLAEAA